MSENMRVPDLPRCESILADRTAERPRMVGGQRHQLVDLRRIIFEFERATGCEIQNE